jgi:hypothetical protein
MPVHVSTSGSSYQQQQQIQQHQQHQQLKSQSIYLALEGDSWAGGMTRCKNRVTAAQDSHKTQNKRKKNAPKKRAKNTQM